MIEVRYKNTHADLLKFNIYHYARSPLSKALIPIFAAIIILPAFQSWQRLNRPLGFFLLSVIINAIVFVVIMSFMLGVGLVLSYLPKLNKTVLAENVLRASEAGLIEESEFNRTETKWKGIAQITQNRNYIFIYISQNAAHVVPKRVFSDEMQGAAFFDAITRWHNGGNTPPIASL